jgi:hypothetical protein
MGGRNGANLPPGGSGCQQPSAKPGSIGGPSPGGDHPSVDWKNVQETSKNHAFLMFLAIPKWLFSSKCHFLCKWLVVWNILEHECYFPFHVWDVILPIDFHIFQRVGLNHQPEVLM